MEATDERLFEPELYRLRGDLLLQDARNSGSDDETAAEAEYTTAIEIARRLGAKSHELRAATSLARLFSDRDRKDEARSLLAQSYGRMTEGFGTHDLVEARALLDRLA